MQIRDDKFYMPRFINIEVTNNCNISCIICPHGHSLVKNRGYMDVRIFKKIIDDLASCPDYSPERINLCGVGESLLHPAFIEMAKYGKEAGFVQMLTTNAYFLSATSALEIIEEDCLDVIEISFDKGKDSFEKFKGGKIYETIKKNIDFFIERNKKIDVRINFLQYDMHLASLGVPQELKDSFKGDDVTFISGGVSSWAGKLDMSFIGEEARKVMATKLRDDTAGYKCHSGADMGMFSWDGSVRACYMDYNNEYVFGNVKDQSVLEIFLSKERREFVDTIADGKHTLLPLCKDCTAPYTIQDREIVLETKTERIRTKGSQWENMKKKQPIA